MFLLAGLLAGLWDFPGVPLEEKNSGIKEKKALYAEINRILGTDMSDSLLQYVGEVNFTPYKPLRAHKFFLSPPLKIDCLQVVHSFSHIHQTYVVHSLRLKDIHLERQSENAQWVTGSALQEAAVSTGVKKVFRFVYRM